MPRGSLPAADPRSIPHILHQTWKTNRLPPRFEKNHAAWRRLHPHWEHRFYDDTAIRAFFETRAPRWLPVYETLPRMIQRVDLFRYLAVYLDGGMYADLDMQPHRPSDSVLEGANCVLSVEHRVRESRRAGLPRSLAICELYLRRCARPPSAPRALLTQVDRNAAKRVQGDDCIEETTGPRMLTRLVYDLPPAQRGSIRIVPQIVWMAPKEYPHVWPLSLRVHARHLATGTWRTERRWRTLWRHLLDFNCPPNPFPHSGLALQEHPLEPS